MFRIIHPDEEYVENHMNDPTSTQNGSTSLVLEFQRLLKSHAERMELFNSSKI